MCVHGGLNSGRSESVGHGGRGGGPRRSAHLTSHRAVLRPTLSSRPTHGTHPFPRLGNCWGADPYITPKMWNYLGFPNMTNATWGRCEVFAHLSGRRHANGRLSSAFAPSARSDSALTRGVPVPLPRIADDVQYINPFDSCCWVRNPLPHACLVLHHACFDVGTRERACLSLRYSTMHASRHQRGRQTAVTASSVHRGFRW